MASASTIMDKPRQEQLQQQQQPPAALKCPRCDSSNTKFCYYNNYSLSQPRHFCKACKRYWTRGGTLRNVPVGGGCRKNKRIKTSSSVNANGTTATSTPSQNPSLLNSINASTTNISSSASTHINGPMFFGLDAVRSGLGFSSSGGFLSHIGDLRGGFDSAKQIQDISLNSNHFHHPTISFDRNSQLFGNFEASFMSPIKEAKMEGLNRPCQNPMEQIDLSSFSDPSTHYWNSGTSGTGNWHDPSNNGSSIASLF